MACGKRGQEIAMAVDCSGNLYSLCAGYVGARTLIPRWWLCAPLPHRASDKPYCPVLSGCVGEVVSRVEGYRSLLARQGRCQTKEKTAVPRFQYRCLVFSVSGGPDTSPRVTGIPLRNGHLGSCVEPGAAR
jgi:hypothetical protein